MPPCPCARAGSKGNRAKPCSTLSASLANAAHKHAPPEAASARAVSAPPEVAVPTPSALFRLPKPNQWRSANMVALRYARRALEFVVNASEWPCWARGRSLAARGGGRARFPALTHRGGFQGTPVPSVQLR